MSDRLSRTLDSLSQLDEVDRFLGNVWYQQTQTTAEESKEAPPPIIEDSPPLPTDVDTHHDTDEIVVDVATVEAALDAAAAATEESTDDTEPWDVGVDFIWQFCLVDAPVLGEWGGGAELKLGNPTLLMNLPSQRIPPQLLEKVFPDICTAIRANAAIPEDQRIARLPPAAFDPTRIKKWEYSCHFEISTYVPDVIDCTTFNLMYQGWLFKDIPNEDGRLGASLYPLIGVYRPTNLVQPKQHDVRDAGWNELQWADQHCHLDFGAWHFGSDMSQFTVDPTSNIATFYGVCVDCDNYRIDVTLFYVVTPDRIADIDNLINQSCNNANPLKSKQECQTFFQMFTAIFADDLSPQSISELHALLFGESLPSQSHPQPQLPSMETVEEDITITPPTMEASTDEIDEIDEKFDMADFISQLVPSEFTESVPHPKVESRLVSLEARKITLDCNVVKPLPHQLSEKDSPMILLHGYLDSKESWSKLVPHLRSHGALLIIPSLRGFGKSRLNANADSIGTSINDLALDCIALLKHLGIEKAIWVGHDLGSLVAQTAAIAYPQYVSKLFLLSTTASIPQKLVSEWSPIIEQFQSSDDICKFVRSSRDLDGMVKNQSLSQSFADEMVAESGLSDVLAAKQTWKSMVDYNCAHSLNQIECSTVHLFLGRKDVIFEPKESGFAVNRRIKKATIDRYADCNHYLHWSDKRISNIGLTIWDISKQ